MPGQKINRTCDNKFLEKVKNERIRLKDSQILNNYCAVQVNFGHRYIVANGSFRNIGGTI